MLNYFCLLKLELGLKLIVSKPIVQNGIPYSGKAWPIDSFQAFGERKFGELIDQPIDY